MLHICICICIARVMSNILHYYETVIIAHHCNLFLFMISQHTDIDYTEFSAMQPHYLIFDVFTFVGKFYRQSVLTILYILCGENQCEL